MYGKNKLNKGSRIFVAGHRGLVGSAIVRHLQEQGYTQVLTMSHQELDLTCQADVDGWFEANQPEYVFLAAALVGGIEANNRYSGDFILQNLLIQTNTIRAAYRNNCKKFLFIGSNCVYPKFPQLPITEDQLLTGPLEPMNEAYAAAKIAGIKLCQHLKKQYGFNAITIMPCNLYGPNDSFSPEKSHVMAAMISKFVTARNRNDATITLWGDGTAQREFMYADDVASAAVLCMLKYNSSEPINVATGEEMQLRDLAEILKSAAGYTGDVLWDTTKPAGTPKKGLDTTKLQALGWQQQYPLQEGIPRAIEWYEQNILKTK
jgi:GDP-L-fucose synthase